MMAAFCQSWLEAFTWEAAWQVAILFNGEGWQGPLYPFQLMDQLGSMLDEHTQSGLE